LKRHGVCLLIPALLALSALAEGQELRGRTVQSVEVQGLSQVSEQLVQSQLEVKVGEPYNPQAVAGDIRRLYDLGFFSHVRADATPVGDAVAVVYLVQEKQTIGEIKIIGNNKVRSRQIRGALSWQEGDAFVSDAYDEEREAILDLYESKGFPNATVDISVEEIAPARVRVTYAINEGRKARIKSITFAGNEVLTDRQLRKLMKTRRGWWFVGGKYDEAVFEADLQKVLDEYANHGRLEAQVVDTDVSAGEGKGLNITVQLAEGPEYHVGTLETVGNFVFDNEEVERITETEPGEVHNRGQVEADASLIEKGYRDSGYVGARVTPQVTLDREQKTTNVVYRVAEGDLKYIEEIKVSGNTVTRDEVIRRELMVEPGQRFDGPAIDASEKRLNNTGYFDKVRLNLEDPDETDPFANLLVDVEEAETGEFSFGGGYSTEEGLGGFMQLKLSNFDITNWPKFTGGGQQFNARIAIGEVRTEYSLGFTDPEFLGYPLAIGFDIFDESYEYRDGADFTEDTSGAQIRLGKNLSPFVTARTALRYRDIDISDIPFYAAPELRRERGGSTTVSSIWGINRNTLDFRIDPTSGSRHDLQLEVAGLGGDNEFLKLEHDSSWYWPLTDNRKWILSFRTREGWAGEYASSDFVPISDRFFAGGTNTVRGYDAQDIGPKVRQYWFWGDKVAVGGDLRLVENLEVKYKITDRFRVYSFLDAGGVWDDFGDFDTGDIKLGAGVGFGVEVPRLGPIRLDWGIPLNPDDDQGSGRLHFTTTARF